MNEIVIRAIRPDEVGTAAALRERMTRELDGDAMQPRDPQVRERFIRFYEARLAAGTSASYVAEASGLVCAMASVYKLINHRSEIFGQPSAYVSNVYVAPEHRRRGLATALTRACVDWARAHGCVVVRLRTSTMGRPVYSAMGFEQSDEMELRLTP